MSIKYSIQGVFIYAAMLTYLLAFVSRVLKIHRAAKVFFLTAFVISVASFIWRWIYTSHVPLQNLFELFITIGAVIYLLSRFCENYFDINQRAIDMLLGVIVLFPAGFVFSETPQQLPPALQSPFFIPHVAAYLLAYILMLKAGIAAACTLFAKKPNQLNYERATYRLTSFGFPLLTLGLVLGSIWAHYAWADYWGWEPKEMWSLATWLVYVGYFHFRYIYKTKYPRVNSVWAIAGLSAVVITLLWVNLSRLFAGLHNYAV